MRKTYYVRWSATGEIFNAIEADTRDDAARVAFGMTDDCFIDDNPPREVLERYRWWHERP